MPLITNDAVVFGLLISILAAIFITSSSENPNWKKFYTFFHLFALLFHPVHFYLIRDHRSKRIQFILYGFKISVACKFSSTNVKHNIKGILNLGWKAIAMFFAGTTGIIIGGPLALMIVSAINPEITAGAGPDEVWRGLATVAGSWIGGGANQTAMFEIFEASDTLFSAMITVDIIVANIWMAFILYGAGMSKTIDRWFNADSSAIETLKQKIADYQESIAKVPTMLDFVKMGAIAFSITALGHVLGDIIAPWVEQNYEYLKKLSFNSPFFWIIVTATLGGFAMSLPNREIWKGLVHQNWVVYSFTF